MPHPIGNYFVRSDLFVFFLLILRHPLESFLNRVCLRKAERFLVFSAQVVVLQAGFIVHYHYIVGQAYCLFLQVHSLIWKLSSLSDSFVDLSLNFIV